MTAAVIRTETSLHALGDGRIEAIVRVVYEDGSHSDFIVGTTSTRASAIAATITFTRRLWGRLGRAVADPLI
jgi:hypothetical protein